ncbi:MULTISPECIES: ATP-binding cassette domain-containing protein [Streptomyces]|uniref:ATP-binding cassette domain-containing protein n=1 Tax=Streptomyces luteosporeus TaxID=173856 RepID=A0ABN3TLY8_9ACTN
MRLEGVGRRHRTGGPWIVRDVALDVPAGTLIRIHGANGSGKSTLLRLIAGIDTPSTGRITGRPRTTAYVPERFPAALPFTAAGYLTAMGRVHGLRRGAAERAGRTWLERLGAGPYANTPLGELSKGSSQKVAVAQALLAPPGGLLALDEAWTGLDPASRAVLDRTVTERVAEGTAVVFVDHDPHRLAGRPDAAYDVAGGRVRPSAVLLDERARGRPRVRVEVQGPPGAALPDGLPGAPHADGHRLTVAAAHSDALLHALLTARPAWHIRSVTPVEEEDPS